MVFDRRFTFPGMSTLVESQARIGWDSLFLGVISKQWALAHQKQCVAMETRRTGSVWARQLSTRLLKLHFAMWENRNLINNSKEDVSRMEEIAKLNSEIRVAYACGPTSVLDDDRHLFRPKVEKVLKRPERYRRWWLETVYASQKLKKKKEKANDGSRRLMRNWLLQG